MPVSREPPWTILGTTTFEPAFRDGLKNLLIVAVVELPVLLAGPRGTGKTVLAKKVHLASSRRNGPFVRVNCAELTESLASSELFGHEKGAFTGAHKPRRGLLREAAGGTLFLDEVGDLSVAVQAKLLVATESRAVRPVGGSREVSADFRLVCATNRDLPAMVADGTFRADLLDRLAAFTLWIPPLDERRRDIRWYAYLFADQAFKAFGWPVPVPAPISEAALALLAERTWPGNLRELRATVEVGVALAEGAAVEAEHVAAGGGWKRAGGGRQGATRAGGPRDEEILAAVEATGGNMAAAARMLGMARSTLQRRIKALRHG